MRSFLIVTAMVAIVAFVTRCSQDQCLATGFACPAASGASVTSSCGDFVSSKSTCAEWSCNGTSCGMQPLAAETCDVSLVLRDGSSHTVNLVFAEPSRATPAGSCPSECGKEWEIAMRVDGVLVASGIQASYNFDTAGCFQGDAGPDGTTDAAAE